MQCDAYVASLILQGLYTAAVCCLVNTALTTTVPDFKIYSLKFQALRIVNADFVCCVASLALSLAVQDYTIRAQQVILRVCYLQIQICLHCGLSV